MEILKFAPFTKFQPMPKFSRKMKDEFLDEISSCRRRYFSYQWRWNFRYVIFQYAHKFFFDLFRKLQTRCWVLYFHTTTYSKSTRKDSKRWFVHYELWQSCPGKITAAGKLWRKISLDASTFSHFDFRFWSDLVYSQKWGAALSMKSFPGLRIALLEHQ